MKKSLKFWSALALTGLFAIIILASLMLTIGYCETDETSKIVAFTIMYAGICKAAVLLNYACEKKGEKEYPGYVSMYERLPVVYSRAASVVKYILGLGVLICICSGMLACANAYHETRELIYILVFEGLLLVTCVLSILFDICESLLVKPSGSARN